MVTRFIEQKEVREKFNTIFIKPKIDKVLLLDNPTDYNATLLGSAIEYFITCHFNYLKKSETDSFLEEVTVLIKRLKKVKIEDTTPSYDSVGRISTDKRNINCYFEFLNKKEFDRFIIKTKKIRDDLEEWYRLVRSKRKRVIKACSIEKQNNFFSFFISCEKINKKQKEESMYWLNEFKKIYDLETIIGGKTEETYIKEMGYSCCQRFGGSISFGGFIDKHNAERYIAAGLKILYNYSNKEISELLEKSLIQYKEYKVVGIITDSFLNAILILSQIMPGIRFNKLAINNMGTTTQNDLNMLKYLIKQIPKSLYEAKNILIQPFLSHRAILGKPDYIMDDSIVDIKTTTSFFSRRDYNQLICYYLLYKINEKKWNEAGIKINKIGIYYSLYGQLIQFNVSELCSPDDLKEIIEFIKSSEYELDIAWK